MSRKNRKKSKYLKWIIISSVVIVVILFIGKQNGWIGKDFEIRVSTEEASLKTITEYVTASGKIQPETEVKLSPDVSGEIVELNIKEGASVKKGDFLLKIKPDLYESALERAVAAENSANANLANSNARLEQVKAQFSQVQLSYNRNKSLYEQGVISDAEYENSLSSYEMSLADVKAAEESVNAARFNVLSSQAMVREATENLRKTSVFAPMDGTVSLLNVEQGERVVGTEMMAGTEMMRIANLNSMEVTVDVNENDIIKVKLKDSVDIEVDAYLNRKFIGLVTEIANSASTSGFSVDQVTNFKVKIRILPESYQDLIDAGIKFPFRPGMSASVDIKTNTEYNTIAIPLPAVTTRIDTSLNNYSTQSIENPENIDRKSLTEVVFVYKDGEILQRNVQTGIQDSYYIQILSGIEMGEEVVTAPYNLISRTLKDKMKVAKVSKNELFTTAN